MTMRKSPKAITKTTTTQQRQRPNGSAMNSSRWNRRSSIGVGAIVWSILSRSTAANNGSNNLRRGGGEDGDSILLSQPEQQQQQQSMDDQERSLIIGGETALIGDYPYFAHFNPPECGGSLIAPNLILTAGHCMLDSIRDYGTVEVGKHRDYYGRGDPTAENFRVVQHVRHPEFNQDVCCGYDEAVGAEFNGVVKDYMILRLSGESTMPIITLNQDPQIPKVGDELHVIGFGDTHPGDPYWTPNRLNEVTVEYISNERCVASSLYPSHLLDATSMCAVDEGEDACNGDSGGPLLIKGRTGPQDVQVGIVSWGWGCADEPGVYSRVSEGYEWIREQVCEMATNPPASFNCNSAPAVIPDRVTVPQPAVTLPIIPHSITSSEPSGTLLPFRIPCAFASASPDVCCASYSNRPGLDSGECVPVSGGMDQFRGGQACESIPWVLQNDPGSFDSNYCNDLVSSRLELPGVRTCASITSKRLCCAFRNQEGQACVPSRLDTGFSDGNVCEAANIVAAKFPNRAMACDDPSFASSSGFRLGQEPPTSSVSGVARSDLPSGRSCSSLASPLVCCAARDARPDTTVISPEYSGQDCFPANNGGRFSSFRPCEPIGWVNDNDPNEFNRNYCDELLIGRELLPEGRSCASIERKDCCSSLDNRNDGSAYQGQPCVPSKRSSGYYTGSQCEPANWVVEHAPNDASDCNAS